MERLCRHAGALLVLALVLLWAAGLALPALAAGETARAVLRDATGQEVGVATFTQTDGGMRIDVNVRHLPPGAHGIHIHETGRCDPPDFMSAGGHFNPFGRQHGLRNPAGPHAGDLPNLQVAQTGTGRISTVNERVTLGTGPSSLLGPGDTALVIHAGPDDEVTDPAGNSGARIACGVLLRAGVAQVPGQLPRTGGGSDSLLPALLAFGAGAGVWLVVRRRR
ncbi:MAG: superoxide dismutase [Chloroflexota bacterium]